MNIHNYVNVDYYKNSDKSWNFENIMVGGEQFSYVILDGLKSPLMDRSQTLAFIHEVCKPLRISPSGN